MVHSTPPPISPSDSSSQTFCPSDNLNHEHSATEKYLQSTDSSSRRISRWTNCQTKFHQPLNTWFVTIRPTVTFGHLKYTFRPSDVSCSYATYVCISSLDILSIKSLRWTNCHSGLILSISNSIGCHSWGAQWLSSREQSARRQCTLKFGDANGHDCPRRPRNGFGRALAFRRQVVPSCWRWFLFLPDSHIFMKCK